MWIRPRKRIYYVETIKARQIGIAVKLGEQVIVLLIGDCYEEFFSEASTSCAI